MRIVDARLRVLRAPVTDGIAMAFAPMTHRSTVLVEVETADGRVGRGESWVNFPTWAVHERVATLRDGVFPLLVGEDADDVRALHQRLVRRLEPLGRQWGAPGPVMQAISGVDIALWDRLGQACHLPCAALLGGHVRQRVAIYASSLGPSHVAEQAAACLRAGITSLKVKLGFGHGRDAENLRLVREAAGPQATILADANQGWSLAEALAMAPTLREFGVDWLEEPIRGNRLEELERLHRETGLALATGENLYGREAFWEYIASPAIAILQPDLTKVGGLTEAVAIAEMAQARGKAVLPHLYGAAVGLAASLQFAAAMPAVAMLEYDVRSNPLRDPLLLQPPVPTGGALAIPQGPGLGLDLDPRAVAAATVRLVAASSHPGPTRTAPAGP